MPRSYHVFLSYKCLGSDGKPTRDSVLAEDIYQYLFSRGLSVFLSTIELESQGVSAYKKAIDEALDASKVLIAVGTTTEHLESEWVRYEWDGFFNDIISGVKPEGRVFAYIDKLDMKALPRALRQSQAITHRDGSLELLYRFVANAIGVDPLLAKVITPERSESKPTVEIESVLRRIDSMIHALSEFHSNPEGIYYIGQTIVECDVFLDDFRIEDEEARLMIEGISDDIDRDERRQMGLFDPIISIRKVRKLIQRLREIRKRFMAPTTTPP